MINNDYQRTETGAIVNTDLSKYDKYKMMRQQKVQEKMLTERVEYLEKQLKQLTDIVNKLIG